MGWTLGVRSPGQTAVAEGQTQCGFRAYEGSHIWVCSAGFQAGLCPGDWDLDRRLHLGTLDRIDHFALRKKSST